MFPSVKFNSSFIWIKTSQRNTKTKIHLYKKKSKSSSTCSRKATLHSFIHHHTPLIHQMSMVSNKKGRKRKVNELLSDKKQVVEPKTRASKVCIHYQSRAYLCARSNRLPAFIKEKQWGVLQQTHADNGLVRKKDKKLYLQLYKNIKHFF